MSLTDARWARIEPLLLGRTPRRGDRRRDRHAPLFTSIPEAERYVRKYTVSHPVPAGNYPPRAYDGLTETRFENWEDHDAFFASENYRTLVNPDEARFIDMESVAVMVTEEKKVM